MSEKPTGLDERFIKGELKMLVDSPFWNKLMLVLKQHKEKITESFARIESQENQLNILLSLIEKQNKLIEELESRSKGEIRNG